MVTGVSWDHVRGCVPHAVDLLALMLFEVMWVSAHAQCHVFKLNALLLLPVRGIVLLMSAHLNS